MHVSAIKLARHYHACDIIEAHQLDHAESQELKARARTGEFDDHIANATVEAAAHQLGASNVRSIHGARTFVSEVR